MPWGSTPEKGRRYFSFNPQPEKLTEQDYLKHLESGENPPTPDEQGRLSRAGRNMAVGLPKTLTGVAQIAGVGWSALTALEKTSGATGNPEDKAQGFTENFADDLYGKQGIAEANQYVADETANQMSRLPPHLRTTTNEKRIQATLVGSKERRDILLKYANPLYKYGQEADKAINYYAGLRDPQEETSADEFMQVVGGSIVPLDIFLKPAVSVAEHGAQAIAKRAALKAAELALPGTRGGAANIAENIVTQATIAQGMRWATDQPNMFSGDAMLAEEMAASGQLTKDAGHQVVQTPSGRLVKPPEPEADPDSGLSGWAKAGIAAGAAIVIGAARGKAALGMAKNVIDDTIAEADKVPNALVPTNKNQLRPALTAVQKKYSDYVDKVKPLANVAKRAMANFADEDAQRNLESVERFAHEAAPSNIYAATERTFRFGEMPGLDRKTVPMERVDRFMSEFKPDELAAFNEGMQLKHQNGEYAKSMYSTQDRIDQAKIAHRNGTGSYAEVKKLEAQLQQLQTTSPFDGMSVQDARTKMAQFDSSIKNQTGERMYRQLASDIREAQVNRGHYTQQEMDKIVRSNPYYVPQVNDPHANATWWCKGGSIIADDLKGRSTKKIHEKRAALYGKSENEHVRVENPVDPWTALKTAIHDFHTYDRKNAAIAQYINTIAGTPEWGNAMRVAHPPTSMTDFNMGKVPKKVTDNNNVVVFAQKGKLHYIEMADPEIARALAFNPNAALGGFDALRRYNQTFLTGIMAPWFAWKGAKYDITPLRLRKQDNHTFGIISASVKHAFPNSKIVDYMNNYVPDGTVKMQMISHAFGDITNNAVGAMGRKIANDLTFQSGFFNRMAQIPGGRDVLQRVGDSMVRAYNSSMYTLLHKEGVLGQSYSNEVTLNMIKGFDGAYELVKAHKLASAAMQGYKSVLESIRSSAKVTFFAQNYKQLERDYKAKGQKVPKSEVDKLIYKTKTASADMTIGPGIDAVAKAASMSNFVKTNVNSLAALGEAAVKRPMDVGVRFFGNAVVPKLFSIGLVSASTAGGLASWYWNDLNDKERAANTPTIKPDFFVKWAQSGQMEAPPLTPDDMMLMPDAPETIAFTSPMVAALQALGVYGDQSDVMKNGRPTGYVNAQQYMNSRGEMTQMIGDALNSLIQIPAPGLVTALFGFKMDNMLNPIIHQLTGDPITQSTMTTQPGDTEDASYGWGILNGIFAQTADMVKHASHDIAPDDNWMEAVGTLVSHTAKSWVKKIPENMEEFGTGTLFGQQRREKATTGTRERMVEMQKKVDAIASQRSLERRGLSDQVLNDPKLMAIRDELLGALNRGGMDRLKKKRNDASNMLMKLERERYKMSTAHYETTFRALQKDMQHINLQQQTVLNKLTNSFMMRFDMSAEDAIDLLAGMSPAGASDAMGAAGDAGYQQPRRY